MTTTRIRGASVWEQELYDRVRAHVDGEQDAIRSYEALADRTDAPAFAYLARLILDDERRHHEMMADLAETIERFASLEGQEFPIPMLAMFGADRAEILAETERFLKLEKEDNRRLDRLAKEMRDVKDTTLWELLIRVMQDDNRKHQRILRFIRDRAREHH